MEVLDSGTGRDDSPGLAYLRQRTLHGVKLGLETTRLLLHELGDPHHSAPVLLVAGTNGKGSVVALLDAILTASGLRSGRYTSPHLARVNERMTVDGAEISDEDLEECILDVRNTAERLVAGRRIADHPTFFETLTVAAFHHFARTRADVVVAEVGMGGRLDATNACEPLGSAVVTIAYDHTEHLGDTLAAIAREKAGVLRAGRPTVVGRVPDEARETLRERAAAVGAHLVEAHAGARVDRVSDTGEATLVTPRRVFRGLRPPAGRHQLDNLLVALRLLQEVEGLGWNPTCVAPAVAKTRWPGRLERIEGTPAIILDGAHNLAAAWALAEFLASQPPVVLVFGAMRDKPFDDMLVALAPRARAVILTRAPSDRAADPHEIKARGGVTLHDATVETDPCRALERACELAGPDGLVVVAGSLYLVGAVREHALGALRAVRAGTT